MKQLLISCLVIAQFLSYERAISQTIIEKPVNYHELIEKGIELFDKGEYNEAQNLYQKVHKSDENYTWACYELAFLYYQKKDYQLAVDKCKEAIGYDYDSPEVYSLLGSVLDDMGKPREGINVILPALEKWPYNQRLLVNLAICYMSVAEYDKAESILLKIIRFYPYHAKSHNLLGKVNIAMGRTAQAYYAFCAASLMNPTLNNIRDYESAIAGRMDTLIQRFKYSYSDNAEKKRWDEVKWFLESELAFSKKFEFKYKLDNIGTRQTQMLIQKSSYIEADTSLYNQLYIRFYKELMAQGLYETYTYYMLQNVGNEEVNQWNQKNKEKINEFVSWVQGTLNRWRSYAYNPKYEKKKQSFYHYYDNDGFSIGMQNTVPDTTKEGYWLFVNNKGGLKESGKYFHNLAQGEYKLYWENSKIKQILNFKDNELDGACLTFYPDGAKEGLYDYKNGKIDGRSINYKPSGLISANENYKNGTLEGLSVRYRYSDGLISKVNYINGIAQGKRVKVWMNGKNELDFNFINDSLNGPYSAWYENGNLRSQGSYLMDNVIGAWKYYHWNGNLQSQGKYDSLGRNKGTWVFFSADGKKEAIEESYVNGNLEGKRTELYPNGGVKCIIDFKENNMVGIAYKDTVGKELYSAKAIDDRMKFKSFFSNGAVGSEGILNINKNHEGEWCYYNLYGKLLKKYNYVDGLFSGEQKTYYTNGQVNEEYSCDSNEVSGLYKDYHINGVLRSIGWMNKGKNVGEWIYYYPNEKLKNKAYFKDGENIGFYEFYNGEGRINMIHYYDSENLLRNVTFYDIVGKVDEDFKLQKGNGIVCRKYSNGKVKFKYSYLDGLLNDTITAYYRNGKLSSQIIYQYGKINGVSRTWDVKGNLTSEANYIMGKEDGTSKTYKDGILVDETNYEGGVETGVIKYYHNNGKIYKLLNYPNGERNGYSYYYSPDGQLMYRAFFINGDISSYSYLDPTGKYVKEIPFTDKTTELLAYFSNGTVSARIKFKEGNLEGKRYEFYSNGKLFHETDFKFDKFHGVEKSYFINGQVSEVTNYLWNKRDGAYISYFENGTKKCEGKFIMDLMEGTWIYYDINGKVIHELKYFNGDLIE